MITLIFGPIKKMHCDVFSFYKFWTIYITRSELKNLKKILQISQNPVSDNEIIPVSNKWGFTVFRKMGFAFFRF